jgi:hypothetical protein
LSRKIKTKDDWLADFVTTHGDLYDYSLFELDGYNKISIICRKHGEFTQNISNHRMGNGCPLCRSDKTRKTILDNGGKGPDLTKGIDMGCSYCGHICDGTRGLSSHERRCSHNPHNKEVNGDGSVEDSIIALDRSNNTLINKVVFRSMILCHQWTYSDCQLGLIKYSNIVTNCATFETRAEFKLTLYEYLLKMVEVNIKPNDIGRKLLSDFQLCRKNDQGIYENNNCFFDTFGNNLATQRTHIDYSTRDYSFTKTDEYRRNRSEIAIKQWANGRGHGGRRIT